MSLNYFSESNNFCGIVLGMNYDYVKSLNLYKQTLFRSAIRANEVKAKQFYMGLTAAPMKRKVGAVMIAQVAYVQVLDRYNISVIDSIANQ